ncbi:hypothetical protein [Cohnella fermenti]|uniref:Uncharacterized protein n=1 Tax=Cohnella fermenti TaxID=2565925 RepID=A0A4S4BWB9_9BACL|nr:hypothetical protein [Cohnella fermenti]THF79466.1 hypothetical protein E6C55_11795 [Cohnella fermenti]
MSTNPNQPAASDKVIIGARALGEQVYKIMPTYDLLLEQLQEIRSAAADYLSGGQRGREELSKQDFNNTLGIFGPRGTGKSSALYTLRVELAQDKSNILLPLIEPDNFGDNTKIIGSIVGLLCKEGNALLDRMRCMDLPRCDTSEASPLGSYFNNGTLKPNNPLKQIMDDTIEYHLYTERQYRDVLVQNYADLGTHIRKSERLLIPDIEFKKKLMALVDTIVDVQKSMVGKGNGSKRDMSATGANPPIPLIYIFIDDIDLKTSKTRELMDALLQYVNHPNIVTVLSGDYDILTESIILALLQDEPLRELGLGAYKSLKSENEENSEKALTILGRKSKLAHEYLKKTIPPARRHQLVKWNEQTIPGFAFGEETLLAQLVKLLGEWSIFSYMADVDHSDRTGKPGNTNKTVSKPLTKSYIIFDERPRGIVNAYYHLNQLLKARQEGREIKPEHQFQLVKAFVDTLILSNSRLLPHQGFIYERFLLWGSEAGSSAIRYDTLDELKGNGELEKELASLRTALYVIGELIRSLLPGAAYDSPAYLKWRRSVVDELLKRPAELVDIADARIKELFLQRNQHADYRLFFLAEALAVLADPEVSGLLVEFMSDSHVQWYKSQWEADNAQAQDELTIRTIHTLLLKEEKMRERGKSTNSLLDELYQQAYNGQADERSDLANFSINLLEALCAETAEIVTAERQFKPLLDTWDQELVSLQIKNKWPEYMELQVKRSLFLNSLISIKKAAAIKYEFDKSAAHIGRMLTLINRERENEEAGQPSNVPDAIYLTLENKMKDFAKTVKDKWLKPKAELEVELDQIEPRAIEAFRADPDGLSYTRYKETKGLVKRVLYPDGENKATRATFASYCKMLRSVENLSQNNRVYYGRKQAAAFLPFLRNAAYFSTTTILKDEDKAAIQQYAKYVGANQIEMEQDAYEGAKKYIKEKLEEAHEHFQMRTLEDIMEYNLNMTDLESDRPGDDSPEGLLDLGDFDA